MEYNVLLIMVIGTTAALMLRAVDGFGPRKEYCDKTPRNLKTRFDVSCIANGNSISECKSLWEAFSGAFVCKDQSTVLPE